ncbi:MAG: hypothetical protein V1909_03505 [Candidatus Micrarchaeota archaeon]
MAKGKKAKKGKTPVSRKAGKIEVEIPDEPPRIDWSAVPRIIAPLSLPMRHDHPHIIEEHELHPEVRLVIKTRYMEQRPHVLAIESTIMATVIVVFFGLLLYLLRIHLSVFVPVLLAVWTLLVVLLYKHFED